MPTEDDARCLSRYMNGAYADTLKERIFCKRMAKLGYLEYQGMDELGDYYLISEKGEKVCQAMTTSKSPGPSLE